MAKYEHVWEWLAFVTGALATHLRDLRDDMNQGFNPSCWATADLTAGQEIAKRQYCGNAVTLLNSLNFAPTGGDVKPVGTVTISCFHGAFIWFLMLIGILAGGCVSAPKFNSNVNTDIEKGQTYLESKGGAVSAARMNQNLAEASIKRREQVSWGGVTFFGAESEQSSMPHCSRYGEVLQAALVGKLEAARPRMFDIKNLGQGLKDNLSADNALIMVVALISENLTTRADPLISGNTRLELSVAGQVLFVDSKARMQVVASYPVGVVMVDSITGQPPDTIIDKLVKEALVGVRRLPGGKAGSICDQVSDMIEHDAILPRSLFPPIAVDRVVLNPELRVAVVPQGQINLTPRVAGIWPDTFASAFASYLGANSGLPINPYVPSGSLQVASDRVLSAAAQVTMRSVENQQLNATLRPPTHLLQLRIDSLTATVNGKKSTTFLKVVNYGFTGELRLINSDTGDTVLSVPLEYPSKKAGTLPAKLASKYEDLSAVKFTVDEFQNGAIDHEELWRDRIDAFLLQLAREIAFPEEDLAKRFDSVRSRIKRNAWLDLGLRLASDTTW